MGPYIVLGMHRGGTSLVSSILISLGVDMGDSFPATNRHNPWGYWEDTDFMRLNSRILRVAGGKWDRPPLHKRILQVGRGHYANAIKELVEQKTVGSTGKGKRWGWKDPRTCLTIQLYDEVLPAPFYIVVKRPRGEIIHSLTVRHRGSRPKKWQQLTDEYLTRLDDFLANTSRPIHYINFRDILHSTKCKNEITKLGWFLGYRRFRQQRDKALDRIQTPHDSR